MKLTYQIDVEVAPGDDFNPIELLTFMNDTLNQKCNEGSLTSASDKDTIIKSIVLGLTSMKGDLPSLVKKQNERARKASPRVLISFEEEDKAYYAEIDGREGAYGYGETRADALKDLYRYYPEAENFIVSRKKKVIDPQ